MENYKMFAYVYDILMVDVNYKQWALNIEKLLQEYRPDCENILELACGTGNITNELAKKGHDIIGTDLSEEMLLVAQQKAIQDHIKVKFFQQDMRHLTINKSFDSIICMCDGINYLIGEHDLEKTFEQAYNHLNNDGLFIFDISTYFKLKNIIGSNIFAENYEDVSYMWINEFNDTNKILEFVLTLFIKNDSSDFFERHIEVHQQKAYQIEEVKASLTKRFELIEILDHDTLESPRQDSKRIYFVCKKKGK